MIISNLFAIWTARELADGSRLRYRDVAAATGMSSATLVSWKLDRVKRFDKASIETLCQYFDCEVADLIVRRA